MFKKTIGLRAKILLAASLGMIVLLALMLFVARTVMLDGFARLEKDKTLLQLDSAVALIKQQSDQLGMSVKDNAHWDDLHRYMVDKNPNFVKSSFSGVTFATLKVNAIFIVDANGEAIYKKGFNYNSGKPWHIPDILAQAVSKGGTLIDPTKNNQTGLFYTPDGICIVAAYDILTSEEKGPRRGTLVMVSLLNQVMIEKIEKILGAKLSVDSINDEEIPFIFNEYPKHKKIVLPLNDNQIGGFALLNPIGGDVKILLKTAGDRKIFEQGKSSLKFLYWTALLGAFLLMAFSWLIDQLVLKRLANLNENVRLIGESATTSGRIENIAGTDELNTLAHGINGMLARLDESQHALQLEKESAQVTLSSIADAVITSNVSGEVLYMNSAAERLTGLKSTHASGKSLQKLFHLMTEDKTTKVNSAWLTNNNSVVDEVLLAM